MISRGGLTDELYLCALRGRLNTHEYVLNTRGHRPVPDDVTHHAHATEGHHSARCLHRLRARRKQAVMTARLQRRRSIYRGASGVTISGRDTLGRRVLVFVSDTDEHDPADVVANIKAGRWPFDSTPD